MLTEGRRNRCFGIASVLALVCALGLSVLAMSAASAPAFSTATPSRMVLKVSDLPRGFYVVRNQTGSYTNRDILRDYGRAVAAKAERLGRITGYRATYGQRDPNKGALPGVLAFGATVSLYRTARGAHAALAIRDFGCRREGFTVIGLGGNPPVGADTRVCTRGKRIGGIPSRYFLVQWRNGRATGGVFVVAAEGAVTPVAALTGGRKQNRRMTAELRQH